ncbi:MAG: hypothetical protein IKR28_00925 [Selenomonadaceae bacterium]|nr:hypothetical protein [Selenomonadaceae bacterium]
MVPMFALPFNHIGVTAITTSITTSIKSSGTHNYDYYGNGQEHPRRVQQFSPGDDAVDNGNGVKVEGLPHKSRINGNDI